MNARKWVNIQGDREFQALSEYIITCSKSYPYINNKVEITREVLLKKFSFLKISGAC